MGLVDGSRAEESLPGCPSLARLADVLRCLDPTLLLEADAGDPWCLPASDLSAQQSTCHSPRCLSSREQAASRPSRVHFAFVQGHGRLIISRCQGGSTGRGDRPQCEFSASPNSPQSKETNRCFQTTDLFERVALSNQQNPSCEDTFLGCDRDS